MWNQILQLELTFFCLGLNYLHTREPMVVHRDIKSPNILICGKDPEITCAKIADFGTATLATQNHFFSSPGTLTNQHSFLATTAINHDSQSEPFPLLQGDNSLLLVPSTVASHVKIGFFSPE